MQCHDQFHPILLLTLSCFATMAGSGAAFGWELRHGAGLSKALVRLSLNLSLSAPCHLEDEQI